MILATNVDPVVYAGTLADYLVDYSGFDFDGQNVIMQDGDIVNIRRSGVVKSVVLKYQVCKVTVPDQYENALYEDVLALFFFPKFHHFTKGLQELFIGTGIRGMADAIKDPLTVASRPCSYLTQQDEVSGVVENDGCWVRCTNKYDGRSQQQCFEFTLLLGAARFPRMLHS